MLMDIFQVVLSRGLASEGGQEASQPPQGNQEPLVVKTKMEYLKLSLGVNKPVKYDIFSL